MMEKQSSSGGCFSFTRIEEVIYTAGGYDGSIRIDTTVDATGFNRGMSSFSGGLAKLKGTLKTVGTAIAGAFVPLTIAAATLELVKFGQEGVRASTELTNAMMGLQSIIEGQGRSFQKAKGFLDEYVSDGLIPMTNAVTSYKNLAARGYDDSQIQSVMTALKDASAYSRQSSYSMGEAVQTATEGLKNENSVLVDNAGVTKNVAKMWDDYAKSIGTTAKELTQQQKIQAEVNGIMEETRFQTGDAAKVAGSFSGQLAQLSYHFNELKVAVGDTLIPLLKAVLPLIDDIVQGLTWVFQKLSLVTQAITGQSADMVQGAGDASDAENDLANSINNASNAAKKALANFDDLNILQLGLNSNSGGLGVGSDDVETVGGLNNALGSASLSFGDFNDKVAIAKNNLDNFTTSLELVKEAALQPIQIPTPIVGKLPDPVYDPNWGLDIPVVHLPEFAELPNPIYNPVWGLAKSLVPEMAILKAAVTAFPLLPVPIYNPAWNLAASLIPEMAMLQQVLLSIPTLRIPVYTPAWNLAATLIPELAYVKELIASFPVMPSPVYNPIWNLAKTLLPEVETAKASINTVPQTFESAINAIIESINYLSPTTSIALSSVLGMFGMFANSSTSISAASGTNIMENARTSMQNFIDTHQTAFNVVNGMMATFVNFMTGNYAAGANSMIQTTNLLGVNITSIFSSAISFIGEHWNGLMSILGDAKGAVKEWWSGNKNWVVPVAGITLAGIAVGSVVISGGASLPAISTLGTAALASIPALATGAVIPPSNQFLAVLGDQKSGVNIETPLSTMVDAFNAALDARGGASGPIEVTVRIIADSKLTRALKTELDNESRRRGVKLVTGGAY